MNGLLAIDPARSRANVRRQARPAKRLRAAWPAATAACTLVFSPGAQASFLPPEMMDKAAMGLAWFIVFAVPIGGIVLFWMVHVLPEKIAHKRHHPQTDAIQTLCLLSLVFGGLLWPLAWLWAYTKPTFYRAAYGTEKHDNYYLHEGEKALAGQLDAFELDHLRDELDGMAERGSLSPPLKKLRRELETAQAAPVAADGAKAGSA